MCGAQAGGGAEFALPEGETDGRTSARSVKFGAASEEDALDFDRRANTYPDPKRRGTGHYTIEIEDGAVDPQVQKGCLVGLRRCICCPFMTVCFLANFLCHFVMDTDKARGRDAINLYLRFGGDVLSCEA